MGVKTELKVLIDELDRVHKGATPWAEERGIPDFVTAENGMERFFTQNARKALRQFATTLHQNRSQNLLKIELDGYIKIVRQSVADMHAEGKFLGFDDSDQSEVVPKLRELIEMRISALTNEHTHYFSAWTLGMERDSAYKLGPVTLLNRSDWIDSVDFSQYAKDNYLSAPQVNHCWKEILKNALLENKDKKSIDGLAASVYGAIKECPSLVKVTIRGYELLYSRKLARLVAKTALDAISLGFGPTECFLQQTLQDERLPPIGSNSIVETHGVLRLPGSSAGQRLPSQTPARVKQALDDMAPIFPAFAGILYGLVDPSNHSHPKLANRWATALDWYGEGCRESNDAIALAKLGTCFDVLCNGGKNDGIREMVVHLTGISSDEVVIGGNSPRTMKQLIKDIYDHGRSKILHGTHYDRLESFTAERHYAAYFARIVLIESAIRLKVYSGPDEDKAFRKIPSIDAEQQN